MRSQNPQSSQKLAKDFSKYISSTYHISHISEHPSPQASLCLRICFHGRTNSNGRCHGVFLFSRLLDSVPDWGRHAGSKGAPKQPKKNKKTYPKHAHHCQGFRLHRLRSVSSRAVIRQCFDKLPATPSQRPFSCNTGDLRRRSIPKRIKNQNKYSKIIGRRKNGKVQSSCSKQ